MLRWLGDVETPVEAGSGAMANGQGHASMAVAATRPLVPPGKIRHLDLLARAGLPVPRGFFAPLAQVWTEGAELRLDPSVERAALSLLAQAPVLVRSALAFEDDGAFSGAGVGHSVVCADLHAIADALRAQRRDADAARGMPSPQAHDAPWVLVQTQCHADYLAVLFVATGPAAAIDSTAASASASAAGAGPGVASGADSRDRADSDHEPTRVTTWIELHVPAVDSLASGTDPVWAGPVAALQHPTRGAVAQLVDSVAVTWASRGEGHDFASGGELELVLEGQTLQVVQARPLPPGRLVSRPAPTVPIPPGLWRLDVEHNPAPLSAAHQWVVARLQHGPSPSLVVLEGWLYERVPPPPPRATIAASASDQARDPRVGACESLVVLLSDTLPTRLREAASIAERLAGSDAANWTSHRDEALTHLRRCIDDHRALSSVRANAGFDAGARVVTRHALDLARPMLPTAWDIAAPLLADTSRAALDPRRPESIAALASTLSLELRAALTPHDAIVAVERTPLPPSWREDLLALDDDEARSCLVELDDLLYASGQLPLRAAWLRAAALLGIAAERSFAIDGDTLAHALRTARKPDGSDVVPPRDTATPPAEVLWDGRAHPSPTSAHARFSAGTRVEGLLRRRVDLDDLQRRPCGPEDIVWLPTLLPQAALLLHAQGVRVVVTTHGGASSHGARMAWELGLTALVGIGPRLDLEDGDLVCLDPGTGQLSVARARSHDPSAS